MREEAFLVIKLAASSLVLKIEKKFELLLKQMKILIGAVLKRLNLKLCFEFPKKMSF